MKGFYGIFKAEGTVKKTDCYSSESARFEPVKNEEQFQLIFFVLTIKTINLITQSFIISYRIEIGQWYGSAESFGAKDLPFCFKSWFSFLM